MVAVARPDHILTLGVNTPGARPEPFDMDDDDGPVYASYDPSRPLLANMVPRVEGGVMNKAFEFPARGVAVSVQACRHCRCSYAAVADGSVLSRYPMWIGMKQRGLEDNSAAVDASEWTPVEFEVALFRTGETAGLCAFLGLEAFEAEFGEPPALYAADAEFRDTGVADFVPMRDVEALLAHFL